MYPVIHHPFASLQFRMYRVMFWSVLSPIFCGSSVKVTLGDASSNDVAPDSTPKLASEIECSKW